MVTYLSKQPKLLTRHPLALRLDPHLIVAPLHKRLFQSYRILNELVVLQLRPRLRGRHLQGLEQCVESRIVALTQQQQQI